MLAGYLDCGCTVTGFGNDLDVVLKTEHHGEPATYQSLVIDDGNPDAHWSPIGNLAMTRNPPSGRGPASKVPPSNIARSRIPKIPWPDPGSVVAPVPVSVTSIST